MTGQLAPRSAGCRRCRRPRASPKPPAPSMSNVASGDRADRTAAPSRMFACWEDPAMVVQTKDTGLAAEALAYVIELYHELNAENGAPTLGTQNQLVEFILADPELCAAVARWAEERSIGEATTRPPQRLTRDAL